jgi:hypothetical protein
MRTILKQLSVMGTRDLRRVQDAIWEEVQRRREFENVTLTVESPDVLSQARAAQQRPMSPLQARVAARSTQQRRAA